MPGPTEVLGLQATGTASGLNFIKNVYIFYKIEIGSHSVARAGLKLLGLSDPPASAS